MEKKEKIVFLIAPVNFRDEELSKPRAVFENNDFKVIVASKGTSLATGVLGSQVAVDFDLAQINPADYRAIILVGGAGATVYFDDPLAFNLIKQGLSLGKIVGAICIAPSILANAGVLRGKKATAFPTEEKNLSSQGAFFSSEKVIVDGRIVTAAGPAAAEEFAQEILALLRKN